VLYKWTPFRVIIDHFAYLPKRLAFALLVVNYKVYLFWRAVSSEAAQARCPRLAIAKSQAQMGLEDRLPRQFLRSLGSF
jgi:hypothetical protein